MTTAHRSRSTLRAVFVALAVLASVVGCSSAPPPVPRALTLVVAHVDGADSAVSLFTTAGATSAMSRTMTIGLPGNAMAYAAVIGPDGNVYVTNGDQGTISIVDGEDLAEGSAAGVTSVAARTFSSPDMTAPTALAFDARGDLWVVDERNPTPSVAGPNRLLRFAAPGGIIDDASIPAATILDLAEEPPGMFAHRFVYALFIDDADRLWYVDYMSWSVGRIDDLEGREGHETDVVPDMMMITWDPAVIGSTTDVANPVGIVVSAAGDLYLGSLDANHVFRFNDAASWTGFVTNMAPSAYLDVGIAKPRFVAIDDEGALWALSNTGRALARVVGHASGSGTVILAPTHTLTWGSLGAVAGGGMRFAAR